MGELDEALADELDEGFPGIFGKLDELDRYPFPYGSEWSAYDDEAYRASTAASVAEGN